MHDASLASHLRRAYLIAGGPNMPFAAALPKETPDWIPWEASQSIFDVTSSTQPIPKKLYDDGGLSNTDI